MRKIHFATLLPLLCGAVHAGVQAQAPINSRLEQNLQICVNCHGAPAFDEPTIDNFLVPRLGGQQSDYIIKALKSYKTRQRDHFFMRGIAANLSEDEMRELAGYFSKQATATGGKK